jgi:hypothetical protein
MLRERDEIEMVRRLAGTLEERLESVVAYGPGAHDAAHLAAGGEYLLIVTVDLEPETLRRLREPVRWWLGRGHSWPRLFTAALLHASADVFPIELVDLTARHRVVFGPDPIAGVAIDPAHLRLQLERELREKLMRLREGYVECHGRWGARGLELLLAASYASFARVFRAALRVLGAPTAGTDADVMVSLCTWLDLPPDTFDEVGRIARGGHARDVEAVFAGYYRALSVAEARIDRWIAPARGRQP